MLFGVFRECMVKFHVTAAFIKSSQGFDKLCHFGDAILRKSLDFIDQFLLFHYPKV